MTWRSKPISAALGFPISRGTWQTTSEFASLRQESRQPSASSSSVKILRSAAVAPLLPWRMRTLHLPQVPLAPQVLSMGRPIQLAAFENRHAGGHAGHLVVGAELDGDLCRARGRSGCHWSECKCMSVSNRSKANPMLAGAFVPIEMPESGFPHRRRVPLAGRRRISCAGFPPREDW